MGSGIFDQHRCREFARAREQFIVGIDFVANRVFSSKPLGSNHLLNLIPDALAILEQQCDMAAERKAMAFLGCDDQRAQPRAQNFVLFEWQDFF